MTRQIIAALGLFASLVASPLFADDEWGDLKIRFLYDGKPPPQRTLSARAAGGPLVPDESLVVDPRTSGIKNIVVWLVPANDTVLPIHPDLREPKDETPVMNIKGSHYQPHVLLVRVGQAIEFRNADPFGHCPNIHYLANPGMTQAMGGGTEYTTPVLYAPERLPASLSDSIYPVISAHVVVTDHPYVGLTDDQGVMVVKNIPTGTWTFRAFQESAGYLKNVIVDGQPTIWNKGRVAIEIKAPLTDMGDVRVSPDNFPK